MDDLAPDLLLRAYSVGLFPMAESRESDEILWMEPRRRAVIPLDRFRVSRTLRKTIRSGIFTVTRDRAFASVVRHCSERDETWINRSIERSYNQLHLLGHAHSIECWRGDELAGGLYGVRLGAAFFGESMFSLRVDASKVALAWLVARMRVGGFRLLDCQFITEHLRSMGAVEIDRKDYVSMLSASLSAGSASGTASSGTDRAARGVDFGALEGLLGAEGSPGADAAASGCFIAQLLGQTS